MDIVANSDNGNKAQRRIPPPRDLTWLSEAERNRILDERARGFTAYRAELEASGAAVVTPEDVRRVLRKASPLPSIVGLYVGNRCRRCDAQLDPDVTDFDEHRRWHEQQDEWRAAVGRAHEEAADRASFLASLDLGDDAGNGYWQQLGPTSMPAELRRHAQLYGLDGFYELPPLEEGRPQVPARLKRRMAKRKILRSSSVGAKG